MSELGRAGMHVFHERASKSTRANRKRLVEEAGRHLDERLMSKQADRNPNVDPSRSSGNEFWVNDGQGGMVLGSFDDALDYGDDRFSRVRRKQVGDPFVMTEIVVHLPKSMCTEEKWIDAEGKERTYYRATDPEQAKKYFEVAHKQVVEALPGGADAIHSRALNVDEYTPHMQYVCDVFMPDDSKNAKPGDLRTGYSDAWGSSRRVRDEGKGKNKGKTVQVSGARKMTERQEKFRKAMVDAGFPVHLEADPIRSKRSHDKADFIELDEQRLEVEEAKAKVEEAKAEVLLVSGHVDEQERQVREAAAKVNAAIEALPRLQADAKEEGRRAGLAEVDTKLAEAEAKNAAAQKALDDARANARRIIDEAEAEREEARKERRMAVVSAEQANNMWNDAREAQEAAQDATGADEAVDMMLTIAETSKLPQQTLERFRRGAQQAKQRARTKRQTLDQQLASHFDSTLSTTKATTRRPDGPQHP